jgi:predicted GNAT superfamily acetyltransferase
MLGVLPPYRDAQTGRRLKLRQRDDALGRGIALIEWTFDPLELKNAFLNIEKLGAIVRRYTENQYGTTTSPLHGGLPTDRCTAEWWIDSPRVHGLLSGDAKTGPKKQAAFQAAGPAESESAGKIACPTNATERISYPGNMAIIRRHDAPRARAIQQTNARLFQDAFSRGLAVTGFARTETEGAYLLEPWP